MQYQILTIAWSASMSDTATSMCIIPKCRNTNRALPERLSVVSPTLSWLLATIQRFQSAHAFADHLDEDLFETVAREKLTESLGAT